MRAIKALGQNFLISTSSIDTITTFAVEHSGGPIVEIGPGKGSLTFSLIKKGITPICIEKDSFLAQELARTCKEIFDVAIKVINDDVLDVPIDSIAPIPYDLIGSLPFNIAKRIIHRFLCTSLPYPRNLYCVLQEEVARKYLSLQPHNTALGAVIRLYARATYVLSIPRTHFSPIPEVDAAFIHFTKIVAPSYHKEIADFIHFLFTNPRKQLRNTLRNIPLSSKSHINTHYDQLLTKRAEELSDEEMKLLYFMYNKPQNDEKD